MGEHGYIRSIKILRGNMRLQTTGKNKLVKTGNKMKKQAENIVASLHFKIKDIKLT